MQKLGNETKKKFYKKWWFWGIVIIIAIGVAGSADDNKVSTEQTALESTTPESAEDIEETKEPEAQAEEKSDDSAKEGKKDTVGKNIDDLNVTSYDSVRNDTTGKWSYILIAEDINITEYAWSAFEKYAKSEDGVLAVINCTRNTTSCITKMGEFLDVSTYEYVEGEEHDANLMYTGQMLSEDFVYDDGKIENIQ